MRHPTELAADLEARGVDLVVLQQNLDTRTPAGRLTFHLLAAVDEFAADLISEGTHEGLAAAHGRGRVGEHWVSTCLGRYSASRRGVKWRARGKDRQLRRSRPGPRARV